MGNPSLKGANNPRGKIKKKLPPPSRYARVYYDIEHPAGFTGSAATLHKHVEGSTLRSTEQWLSAQDAYTLHKHARNRFKHPQVYSEGIDDLWSADLADMQHLASENDGVRYLLVVIDVLSKYGWARPLRNKTGESVSAALQDIFDSDSRIPRKLRTDRGTEFLSRVTRALLKRRNIVFYTADNYSKASHAERLIRTLKGRLWRYFRATNGRRYVDVLQDTMSLYNNSYHSSIRMTPGEVTPMNHHVAWQTLYGHLLKRGKERRASAAHTFAVGDEVRISKLKGHFEKGYGSNWTTEIFTIKRIDKTTAASRPTYKLKDNSGEDVLGSFQTEELQRVRELPKQIGAIVKRQAEGTYVRWRGLPKRLVTFIPKG
jgi:hypothetical protein